MPGKGESGPGPSLQQALASPGKDPSSKVISSMPSCWYAGELRIFGTHVCRNRSISATALVAGLFTFEQGKSCPSSHRLGTMNERLGVVARLPRSVARPVVPVGAPDGSAPETLPSGTTCASQYEGSSMTEWKYTKGSWRLT